MAFGEEYDGVVTCKLESGSCLYCPEGKRSPVGSPLCQWGAMGDLPEPPVYPRIMP